MSVSLVKGQKISLKKDGGGNLINFCVGANWGAITTTGFFGNKKIQPVDLDLSVALFNDNGSLNDVVYFGNKDVPGIHHSGDDLVGDTDGDDGLDNEIISVDLSSVNSSVSNIVFVINSYNHIKFNDIPFASIRLYEGTASRVNSVFATYNIANDSSFMGKEAMILGKLYKKNGEWKFSAIGEATSDRDLDSLISNLARFL